MEKEQLQDNASQQQRIGEHKAMAKTIGLKSTLVFDDKVVLTSFADSKKTELSNYKSSNIEKVTDFKGNDKRGKLQYPAVPMFTADINADEIEITGKDRSSDDEKIKQVTFANPAKGKVGQDYIGIKSKIEQEIFEREFVNDNLHIQIGYNILDIKKILGTYINNIIYIFYNINRSLISDDEGCQTDLIGTIHVGNNLGQQQDFVKNNEKKAKELEQIKKLLGDTSAYYTYFGDALRKIKLKPQNAGGKSKEYDSEIEAYKKEQSNYDTLRLLSLIRQMCIHSTPTGQKFRESALFCLGKLDLHKYESLLETLDCCYEEAINKINDTYVQTSANNLYILKEIYRTRTVEELSEQYYRMTVRKEDLNIGVNVKKIRETIIKNHLEELSDKKFNLSFDGDEIISFRSKLYTVMNFILLDVLNKNDQLRQDFILKLRANGNDESGKERVYNIFAEKIWVKAKDQLIYCIDVFKAEARIDYQIITNDKDKKFASEENVPPLHDVKYALSADNTDYFVKMLFFVCKFLDGKEINELMCSMINKFDNIADLQESAKACGLNVEFNDDYQLFSKSREISEQLRCAKDIASRGAVKRKRSKTKTQDSFSEQLYLDALALFGKNITKYQVDSKGRMERGSDGNGVLTEEYLEFKRMFFEQPKLDKHGNKQYKDGKLKIDHSLRNFIINNVLKSKWFFYVVKYNRPAACCQLVRNKNILKFVLKDIPDAQIARYYKSVYGSAIPEGVDGRKQLIEELHSFSVDKGHKQFKNINENHKALFRLYLTVAYLITKSIVKVNTRFAIAFSMQERDRGFLLENTKNSKNRKGSSNKEQKSKDKEESGTNEWLALTESFAKQYEEQFKERRQEKANILRETTDKEERKKRIKECERKYNLHYDQHSYEYIKKNLDAVMEKNLAFVIARFRDHVVHLNFVNEMAEYLKDVKEVTSYYSLYCYCAQRYLCDKYDNAYLKEIGKKLCENGDYFRALMWLLNIPFAYNLARYKNLSNEDLFYDKHKKNADKDGAK